jgi:N-acetylmuramoyl-L-alanine amidase
MGPVIVLDPAHGGTDPGARGQNGPIEKDVVLQLARAIRVELVRQGYRVVLTRDDDSNPSYDDRAALTNAYHDAILITLHCSSTGTVGTTRAYFYQFWSPFSAQSKAPSPDADQTNAPAPASPVPASSLVPWNEAQRSYVDASHRLADQLQIQLAQAFSGSPALSKGVAIRGLRSVAAPAVSIEVSSVSATDAASLTAMAMPLATSIAKGLQSFRPANSAGAR